MMRLHFQVTSLMSYLTSGQVRVFSGKAYGKTLRSYLRGNHQRSMRRVITDGGVQYQGGREWVLDQEHWLRG